MYTYLPTGPLIIVCQYQGTFFFFAATRGTKEKHENPFLASISSTMGSITRDSKFAKAAFVPPDAIFEVTKRYLADPDPNKVNLGQGTYRDGNGNPWVLPSVRMAKTKLGDGLHEYLPIAGLQEFRDQAVKVVFEGSQALGENRASP
jgi:hypothetical protein